MISDAKWLNFTSAPVFLCLWLYGFPCVDHLLHTSTTMQNFLYYYIILFLAWVQNVFFFVTTSIFILIPLCLNDAYLIFSLEIF